MKLAFIRRKYTPYGGAERFLESYLPHLAAQPEMEISLLSSAWSGDALPDWLHWQAVPSLPLGSLARALSFERNVCRAVREGGFDLVQSHERVPCADLYRAGDGVHREWLRQRRRVLGKLAWARVALNPFHQYLLRAEQRLFRSARLQAVITNSEMVKQEIRQHFGLPAERIHTIYAGVDLERFHPEAQRHRNPVREQFAVPRDAPLFLYIGSGFQRKGLAQALEALPEQAWLLVVGRDKQQRHFETLAQRWGKAGRVRFLGPQKSVESLYGAADALVLPTLYDPFPNVCFEAMATGIPVITSTKSGAAELLQAGHNGFVCDALDSGALRRHMQALAERTLAQAMGAAARATAERYPMAQAAQQTLALYRSLLETAAN
jgi:UDP-glucose:(heptosyl)LPS alpha-1,3-glucosyltransferase